MNAGLTEGCSEGVDTLRFFFKLNVLTFFPLTVGCSEGIDAFIFFFKQ